MQHNRSISPHHETALTTITSELSRRQNVAAVVALGTGKTVLAGLLADWCATQGETVLVLVGRRALRRQFKTVFQDAVQSRIEPLEITENFATSIKQLKQSPILVSTLQMVRESIEYLSHFNTLIGIDVSFEDIYLSRKTSLSSVADAEQQKRVLITSSYAPSNKNIFGEPVYTYSIAQAINDQVLCPVEYFYTPPVTEEKLSESKFIIAVLNQLFVEIKQRGGRKILVVCHSLEQASTVFKAIDLSLYKDNRLLIKDVPFEEINEFLADSGKYQLAVTADQLVSDFYSPTLTDIIIFRKVKSENFLHTLLANVSHPHESKDVGRLWDLYGENPDVSATGAACTAYPLDVKYDQGDAVSHKKLVPVGDLIRGKDLLGRDRLVHVLRGVIENNKEKGIFRPFVIGLFGKWGSGKSTVIHLLKEKFKENHDYRFIEFNCWQNEHCHHMGAALAEVIVEDRYSSRSLLNQLWLVLVQKVLLKKDIVISCMLLLCVITVGYAGYTFFQPRQSGDSEVATVLASLALFATGIWGYFNHPFTKQINALMRRPEFSDHLGVAHKVKQSIKALLDADSGVEFVGFGQGIFARKASRQYIVVVDDLDRCDGHKIIEVIEAVKLIIDLPYVVVIMAVDKDILHGAVARRYREQDRGLAQETANLIARDYLGKVLQLTVELNDPGLSQVNEFVSQRLYSQVIESDKVAQSVASNQVIAGENTFSESVSTLLNDSVDVELTDEDYEFSEDYINASLVEAEYFSQCIGAFNLTNPRSLIRLHNILLMIKGLYPEVSENEFDLKIHIFLVFFIEYYSLVDSREVRSSLDDIIFNRRSENKLTTRLETIKRLHGESKIDGVKNDTIRNYLLRIGKLSLPTPMLQNPI